MKKINKIDLSKIKAKNLVEKKIKANFTGTAEDYYIHSLTDGNKFDMMTIMSDTESPFRVQNLHVFLLAVGLDIPHETAKALYDANPVESIRVANEILKLDTDFDFVKKLEAETAEKNSSADAKANQAQASSPVDTSH